MIKFGTRDTTREGPVATLQDALDDLGFSPGKVDGIFGKLTRGAVNAFCEAYGLPRVASTVSDDLEELILAFDRILDAEEPPDAVVQGLDVSGWQTPGKMNWAKLRAAGVRFVIVKCSQGRRTERQGAFPSKVRVDHARDAQSEGIVVGGWHHGELRFHGKHDARGQAEAFAEYYEDLRPNMLPWLSMEWQVYKTKAQRRADTGGGELPAAKVVRWGLAFLARLEELTGHKGGVYTPRSFWVHRMGMTTDFQTSGHPLWQASYKGGIPTEVPPVSRGPLSVIDGWDWTLWQWTGRGRVDGYPGNLDRNVFRGDWDDFELELGVKGAV